MMVRLIPAAALVMLAACSPVSHSVWDGASSLVPAGHQARYVAGSAGGKIQHVVIIVQENRSFDNLFQGYPGADTVSSGKNSKGQTITLQPVSLARQYVIDHSAASFFLACDGTGSIPGTDCQMGGLDKESS